MALKRIHCLWAVVVAGMLLAMSGCGVEPPNLQSQTSNENANATKTSEPSTTTSHTAVVSTVKALVQSAVKTLTNNNQTKSTRNTTSVTNAQSTGTTNSGQSSSSNEISQIKKHLLNQEQSFTVPVTTSASLDDAFKGAMSELPYIHWNIASYRISSDGLSANINVDYRETKTQTNYVDSQVQQILGSILKPGMTNVYKEYTIHNWIVSHMQYDTSLQIDTAYDALKTGHTVCQGYALLAYRMLTKAGIPTKIETGTVNGEAHMWDEVNLDGTWYQLDPTWDDPVGNPPSEILYTYFNVTNQELAQSHQWKESDFPIANTDFSTQLKSWVKRDPQNASQYETILNAVGANLPLASTPQDAHQLMQQALQAKQTVLDFEIQSTQANSSNFMSQAEKRLVTSTPVSYQYSVQTDVRKGQNVCSVHLTFKYN